MWNGYFIKYLNVVHSIARCLLKKVPPFATSQTRRSRRYSPYSGSSKVQIANTAAEVTGSTAGSPVTSSCIYRDLFSSVQCLISGLTPKKFPSALAQSLQIVINFRTLCVFHHPLTLLPSLCLLSYPFSHRALSKNAPFPNVQNLGLHRFYWAIHIFLSLIKAVTQNSSCRQSIMTRCASST